MMRMWILGYVDTDESGRWTGAKRAKKFRGYVAAAAPTELSSSFLVWLWRKKLLRLRRQRRS